MPSSTSFWLVSSPVVDNDPQTMLFQLDEKIQGRAPGGIGRLGGGSACGEVRVWSGGVEFKTPPLSTLLTLSESLAKSDPVATQSLHKIAETISNLITTPPGGSSNDSSATKGKQNGAGAGGIEQHLVMEDGSYFEEYVFPSTTEARASRDASSSAIGGSEGGWRWNRGKYRAEGGRKLEEVVDGLVKDLNAVESLQKSKLQAYNLAKGQLQQLQKKKTGNLSTRSLNDIVPLDAFEATKDSEYLETVLVAVPKSSAKEFNTKYERLTNMVVPRSATKLAEDGEYHLYSVVVFKKVIEEFLQKLRENKYTPREYDPNPEVLLKQKKEFEDLERGEKELWTDLLRISRLNFSDTFQLLVHLKFVRAYVESVLRYGLPSDYFYAIVKPDPKQSRKTLATLSSYFSTIVPSSQKKPPSSSGGGADDAAVMGEYATLMEQEWTDFVLFEIPSLGELKE